MTPRAWLSTWSGLRPLIKPDRDVNASKVSREHHVESMPGFITIAGGKLTTYRRMATEALRTAIKWLREHDDGFEAAGRERSGTKHRPLPGAVGLESADLAGVAAIGRALIADHGIDGEVATHLCGVYGARAGLLGAAIAADRALGERMNPDLHYVWAEVEFAVAEDRARTIDDVLSRRVPLLLVGRQQGLDVCEAVADRMAARLGWSADERARQIAAYQRVVADSRRFRTAP